MTDEIHNEDLAQRLPLRLSRRRIAAMLGIGCLLVASIGYVSFDNARARAAASEQQEISREIRDATAELLSQIKDAETGQRGFLITGDEQYLEPYNSAAAAVPRLLDQIQAASARRPDQQQRLEKLRPLISQKISELAETITLRRLRGFDPAQALVETDRGKALMDQIRSITTDMRTVADQRLQDFAKIAEDSATRLRLVSVGGSLALLIFLILAANTVLRALTQRERLYFAAAASSERFRVTLASIGDAVIATDTERKITFINDVACQLTGWTEAEALGTTVEEVFNIVNETTRAIVANPLVKALETGVAVGLANHTVLIRRDGSEFPIDDSGSPIRAGKDGVIVGAILVFRDISERRETERQLKSSNAQLKNFVDSAAHDLRAPLRSIHAYAQLLASRYSEALGTEGWTMLGFIAQGGERMNRLLDSLVSYAHASHFETPPERNASLEVALQAALENLRTDIEAASAKVEAEALPVVAVRELHLVQLLQNLIGNAIKYRGERQPRIFVSSAPMDNAWRIAVRDNGIGMNPESLPSIFEPFKRLHGDEVPGNGIGLATCKKIVEGYGGKIWVESKPGEGSSFFFTLPVGDGQAASAAD